MGFPRFRTKRRPVQSVSFVELNHQLSWLNESRHAVRLMLPQSLVQSKDPHVRAKAKLLVWVHTTQSTRRLYRLVEDGRASIQKVTYSYRGGRWQVSFQVRYQKNHRPGPKPRRHLGPVVGVDLGVKRLATLSEPVPHMTDEHDHAACLSPWTRTPPTTSPAKPQGSMGPPLTKVVMSPGYGRRHETLPRGCTRPFRVDLAVAADPSTPHTGAVETRAEPRSQLALV